MLNRHAEAPLQSSKCFALDRSWCDVFRWLAITGVFSEHWFEGVPEERFVGFGGIFVSAAYHAGSFVHVFFLLSGYALIQSALKRKKLLPWRLWLQLRIRKVIVPYWIACIATFILGHAMPQLEISLGWQNATWIDLLAHLLLLQNQIASAGPLNESFWFVPVIFGLYLVFPILWYMINRLGVIGLLGIVAVVQTTTILIACGVGWMGDHSSTFFMFHLLPFVVGMSIGKLAFDGRLDLKNCESLLTLIAGVSLVAFAGGMAKFHDALRPHNDSFFAIGLFLVALFFYARWGQSQTGTVALMAKGGRLSYVFYLIHWPIVVTTTAYLSARQPTMGLLGITLAALMVYAALMAMSWGIAAAIDGRHKPA